MITHLLAGLIVSGMAIGDVKLATPVELSLQNAARLYRIQVYDTFRLDRSEFDRRHAEWVRIAARWETAGKPNRDVPAMLHWLEIATANSRPEAIAPLPELPRLAADSSRRRGSARRTILERVATDRLKSGSGATATTEAADMKPDGNLTAPDASGSENDFEKPVTSATPVSVTNTLNQGAPGEAPTQDETAPVPGSDASQSRDANATSGPSTDRGGLYRAYGERLGQNLGSFAAAMVRKHGLQDASRTGDGASPSVEAASPQAGPGASSR